MPDSDGQDDRPRAGRARGDGVAPPQLPPTVMTAIDDDEPELPSEATRATLALPPTDPDGDAVASEALDAIDAPDGRTDPPPYIASRDVATPRGLVPPPRSASELAQRPAPDARERAAASREKLAYRAVVVAVGAAIALGVVVIVLHLTDRGDRDDGPILVIAASDATPAARDAAPIAEPSPPIDRSATIEELERLAASHLASGSRADAAAVYRVLAERAPHSRAFGAAARVLAEETR